MLYSKRRTGLALTLAIVIAAVPAVAAAHGFGDRFTLPVPLWLYLYGAAAAVILSFIVAAVFFSRESDDAASYPRYNLLQIGFFRSIALSPWAIGVLRGIGVLILVLVIAAGLFGSQRAGDNLAPTLIWIIWWVGLGFAVILFGNLWHVFSPWVGIHQLADFIYSRISNGDRIQPSRDYPDKLGLIPAFAAFIAFAWVELVYESSAVPSSLAALVMAYALYTVGGAFLFGLHPWLRHGDVFSVYFGILARLAPTETRVVNPEVCSICSNDCRQNDDCINCYECFSLAHDDEKEINLRPPAADLLRGYGHRMDETLFVLLMLASVSFDGFLVTPQWIDLYVAQQDTFIRSFVMFQTLGLAIALLLFSGAYYLAITASRLLVGTSVTLAVLLPVFIYSLVPIAAAYNAAHYFTLLLGPGQRIIALISDPFGFGWNLLGTTGYQVNDTFLGAEFIWYAQVALIVLGHIVAVVVAHVLAVRVVGNARKAMLSQLPVLVLMIVYTVSSLWIIAQDTVG